MRKVYVHRKNYEEDRTLGWITVMDGPIQLFRCASLELPWKNNLARISCIPAGTYPLVLEHSAAFGRKLWEIKEVPGRSECKFHAANYPKELLGCIAPGMFHMDINKDGRLDTGSSKLALAKLHEALDGMTETTVTVVGDGRDKV